MFDRHALSDRRPRQLVRSQRRVETFETTNASGARLSAVDNRRWISDGGRKRREEKNKEIEGTFQLRTNVAAFEPN
jgi:hypothetical protein